MRYAVVHSAGEHVPVKNPSEGAEVVRRRGWRDGTYALFVGRADGDDPEWVRIGDKAGNWAEAWKRQKLDHAVWEDD